MTIVFVMLCALCAGSLSAAPGKSPKADKSRPVPPVINMQGGYDASSVLVRYWPDTPASDKAAARALLRGSPKHTSRAVPGLEYMSLAPGVTVEKAVRILNQLPFVDYAHPNYVLHLDQVPPDDEFFLDQWGLNNTGQSSVVGAFLPGTVDADIDWLEARALANGDGIVVAVLDTGIDYRHTDIAPNVWLNEAELNGIADFDDDGNGYIDDVRGWDFVNEDPFPLDGHGHGTMVAGIIAAVTGNTKGVAGIMPGGQVMALKVIGDAGEGTLGDAVQAIEYALDKGVRISNSSWGYSEILPEEEADHNALFDIMQAAQAYDHLFVMAAGNDGIDTDQTPHYPSSFALDNVIAVTATNNLDELAWFSSFGRTSVDIAAPGDVIISVHKLFGGFFEDYAWESGTSLAAPHVSGVAGLVLELQPTLSYRQIRTRILATARQVPGLAGSSATGGIVNAHAALDGLPVTVTGMDVLPDDPANVVYPNQSGKIPVVVLSSATFDAAQVDPASLGFGDGQATPTDPAVIGNVDSQFGDDTTVRFQMAASGIVCNDTSVSVVGETYSGEQFIAEDMLDATECEAGGCHAY
jgi:subtilisin family serine protease